MRTFTTTGRRGAIIVAGTLLISTIVSGCSGIGRYLESRALDLWDTIPTSVTVGGGGGIRIKATQLINTGVGAFSGEAYGMAPGRWGPRSYHEWLGLIFLSGEGSIIRMANWPGGPSPLYYDENGFGSKSGIYGGSSYFLFCIPWQLPHSPQTIIPHWTTWLDLDLELSLGVAGIRVAACPVQFLDFLAGIIGLDPLGDDIQVQRDQPDGEESDPSASNSERSRGEK